MKGTVIKDSQWSSRWHAQNSKSIDTENPLGQPGLRAEYGALFFFLIFLWGAEDLSRRMKVVTIPNSPQKDQEKEHCFKPMALFFLPACPV